MKPPPDDQLSHSPLGNRVTYYEQYNPDLLFAIARQEKRLEIGFDGELPFKGEDIWNAYELSWINPNGLPQVALGEFRFALSSPYIVESKSFKLYLNSLNQTVFQSLKSLERQIREDLSRLVQCPVKVNLLPLEFSEGYTIQQWKALVLESEASAQSVRFEHYDYRPQALALESGRQTDKRVKETLCSHLLKSNCLITHQPDWASLYIQYEGAKIDHQALLRYIVSFRRHNEFHEQCVERIYRDLMTYCCPETLTVYARYTRRGGLDINPWRSNHLSEMDNMRLIRQ